MQKLVQWGIDACYIIGTLDAIVYTAQRQREKEERAVALKRLGYVVLTLKFRKEGDKWTARCMELGTATFGPTLEEAEERIREAVTLHLNTLEDVGERERFFKEHNITHSLHKPRSVKVPTAGSDERSFYQAYIPPVPAGKTYATG